MKMIGKVDDKVHKELKKLSVEMGLTMSDTIKHLLNNERKSTLNN